ncbi:MAG: SbcC/MukB-like Walker B domain-containing protein, partial [Acidimicrobiales bacterium]
EAEAARHAGPDRRHLEGGIAAHDEVVDLASARPGLAGTAEASAVASASAAASLADARARHEARRQAAAAFAVAATVQVGAPCPVCRQTVAALPHHDEPADWHASGEEAARAERDATAAQVASERAGGRLADHDERAADAGRRAEAAGPRAALDAALLALDQTERAVEQARHDERGARQRAKQARNDLTSSRQAEDRARRDLDAGRDRVAALGAPPLARQDLAADWAALVTWAAGRAPVEEAEAAAATAERAAADAAAEAEDARLRAVLGAAGVTDVPGRAVAEVAAAALAAAQAEEARVSDLAAAAEVARRRQAEADEEAGVAGSLALHLKADRFEKWLLDEAVAELLGGATTVLHELSAGAYSLVLDAKRDFAVVDHRNADERRPIRTLSGGETFLASLALALSLADRVSMLASGQVRLESLFLDEGFGTLDPEALDTVGSAIEHLGASGRMVGVVTHVAELADRLPVRFAVRRGVEGSTVERIDQ